MTQVMDLLHFIKAYETTHVHTVHAVSQFSLIIFLNSYTARNVPTKGSTECAN